MKITKKLTGVALPLAAITKASAREKAGRNHRRSDRC